MAKNLPSLKRNHLYKQAAQQHTDESLTRQALVNSRMVKTGHLESRGKPSSICRGFFP